ncbi:elongation factor G [Planctellipticum variicoloris]|uniref:elongation factor G n=1 Tax=Planctellipticum variicoloris TaxID=3064265 RepID=UPI003013F1DB|nr:elongation factor G [Planctomycetaceae bacterium SH412]
MSYDIQKVRNIGIIAHIDAGKTTTTERILFYAKSTHRMGDVDSGNTITDFDPEEAARGITIYSAAVTCHWLDHTINIIDTPGHVDFTAEVERSLRVLDGGVVVFSAVEGVEAQSETVWRQADRYRVPRICFINKLDRIGASFERTFNQVVNRLHGNPLALQIPIGEGPATNADGFRGVIDLVAMQALYFDPESQGATIRVEPIPESEQERADEWRVKLLDAVAMLDDEVFAVYDATGDLPPDQIRRVVRKATLAYQLQPLLCGSSLNHIGVQPLLDGVVWYLPSPADVPPVEGRNPNPKKQDVVEVRKAKDDEPFAGLVFKIVADQHNELCFVRIYSGTLKSRSRLLNPRTGAKELVSQLWRIRASDREKLEEAFAGDIVGVVGPKDSATGDTLCDQSQPILLESIRFPDTVISMAIEPETSAERKKLEEVLRLMSKQDPTFRAEISEETGQTIISGMGELHLEIIAKRMQRDFGLKIRVYKPRVTYRETVAGPLEHRERFEHQAANSTQFVELAIRIEPFSGTEPVTIENKLKPGTLPPDLLNSALQALRDESSGGGLVGYPLMNVKITVTDAEYREKETTEVAVKTAAARALRNALQSAGVVLLEPIMKLEVVTPEDFLGNITADLSSRRAMIVDTEIRGNLVALQAESPLSQMFGYSTQVRSLSQGRASYSMEPLRFDAAPDDVLAGMLGQ